MNLKKYYAGFMLVFAFFIALNFGIHVYRTDLFNKSHHTINAESSDSEYTFTLTPQNDSEISWTRTAHLGEETIDLNACSYEGNFVNQSEVEVSDWTMRLDIAQDCYVNGAWCGLVEIHQDVNGEEKVQTLDLRNFDKSEVTLTFYEDGDIYLFPLNAGDYLIYYPNEEAKETGFAATKNGPGQTGIGIIFYWDSTKDFTTPTYSVEYSKHKTYTQGREATICRFTSYLWMMMLVAGIAANIASVRMQKKAEIEQSKREIKAQTTEKMLDQMIKVLASSIDAKDEYTHGHSERVAQYALRLAQELNLPGSKCKEIFYAGLVHDVGKIAVSENIINKPGKLTEEEFDEIKTHPLRGERILAQIEDMPYLAIGAKYHHERYDGNGYPCGVKGEEIPLLARIIAVADSYDAMTSHRSYRATLDQRIVKQEIWKGIGTQFDPLVAKHMIALIDADVDYDMREKNNERYEIIDQISSNEFWQDYNPKSIKSEVKVMSDTSLAYFGEFILTVDHWCDPIKLAEITSEQEETATRHAETSAKQADTSTTATEVRFTSLTNADADFIWNSPTVLLYTSEDGEPVGKGYLELAVFMSAGYSWKTGITVNEESTLTRKEAFVDWDQWIAKNKEGMTYRLRAKREENMVLLEIDNDLLLVTGKIELPKDFDGPLYLAFSGENCKLVDME